MANHKYTKGSEWRKWDLHIHTRLDANYKCLGPSSLNTEDLEVLKTITGLTAEEITSKEKEISSDEYAKLLIGYIDAFTDTDVIAITDHNRGDELDRIIEESKRSKREITVLPGVEVTSNHGIHILCLFNPQGKWKNSWQECIDHFLTEIGLTGDRFMNGYPASSTERSQDILEITNKKGGLCIFAHIGTDNGLFKHSNTASGGSAHIDIYAHPLCNIVEIPHSGNLSAGVENIVNGRDPQYGNKRVTQIKCSDSRKVTEIGTFFSWIKAEPSFEGLKQIVYEPELRIKVQEDDPRESETYARIEKCFVSFPSSLKIRDKESEGKTDFCLQGEYSFEFSNNLTCIIGGRGSGKSTLVHLLYNSSDKKDVVKLDDINSPLISLVLHPDCLAEVKRLTTTDIPEDTEFFLQNEIEKIARNIDEMSTLIRHRLVRLSFLDGKQNLKDIQHGWDVTSSTVKELIKAYDYLSEANSKIEALKKQIEILKKQTAVIKSKEYKDFQKEIEEINNRISAFKRYKNEYISIVNEIDTLATTVSRLNWDQEQGKDILEDFIKSLHDCKAKLVLKFSEVEGRYDTNKYVDQLTNKKLQMKKYLEKKGLSAENIEELADASEQIKELEDKIHSLERGKAPYETICGKRDEILENYKGKYTTYHKRFFDVATQLGVELKGLPLFDKEISFTPKINVQLLQEAAVEFVKKNGPSKVTLRADDIQSVLFDVDNVAKYLSDKNKIKECVSKSGKTILHKQVLQELVNDAVFLERLYLLMWGNYYDISNIQAQTKLGDKLLQNTSFGERCGIVISILLVAGTNPIVIDQPEDNLDGKFISKVLVPLIRKQKLNRQIILVTRDANIVVGGDADLIHILESDEKKTKLIPSSIENVNHREKYIWILDGGKEAFQKREQKYGFHV